jgi:hydrogenase maturation factor HypF (carbamoyltransferase family)
VEARKWIKNGLVASPTPGFASPEALQNLDHSWWAVFLEAIKKGQSRAELAFRFHQTLVDMIVAQARRFEVSKIAFSGGVFQNTLLVELLQHTFLDGKTQVYFHQQLSPNDENIAFGQMIRASIH